VADDPRAAERFAFAVPLPADLAPRLDAVRLAVPGRATVTLRPSALATPVRPGLEVKRTGPGRVTLRWDASAHPMAMVRDPATGQVLARFDDGTTQHFLVTHSVNNTTATAARWYEFRAPSGSTALSLFQSGETLDDGHYRWMGSVARDKDGNIALGYSRSSSLPLDYPSVYVAGQTAGEPPGTTDLESLIFPGTGSQIDTGSRWGDYTSMALDGADRCSFWYTNEYYKTNGSFAWSTRVAEIKFPTCP